MTRLPAQPLSLNVVAAGAALCLAACGGGSSGYRADASTAEQPMSVTSATAGSALYDEPYRPQLQFTPAKNWMNDPNGLVWFEGEYHLFYQYNPNGTTWGDMSWGHAVSKDLVHWEELPVALPVEKDAQGHVTQMFFSGSAVVDEHNTSGFGRPGQPAMVAIFTSVYPQRTTLDNGRTVEAGTQAQSIAYSTDRGRTWTQYAGNPVIPLPPAPYQDQFRDFRDPKVFWYEPEQKWVMVAVLAQKHKAVLYSSKNLKDWTFMSEFGPANAVGGQWECPDLFELPVDGDKKKSKWVLVININPGAIAGGSSAQYFTGSFDGTRFTVDPGTLFDWAAPPDSTVFEDFEGDNFAGMGWTATGSFVAQNWPNSWGSGDNRHGSRSVDTFLGDDSAVGTLESREFTIDRKYINLLVGGGRHPHVDGTNDGSTSPGGEALFAGAGLEGPAGSTYASLGWQATGNFVGQPVSSGQLGGQSPVTKFEGGGLINTFVGGDAAQGRLVSPSFVIGKPYINFLIGGGSHPYENGSATAVVLVVDGKVVRSATGLNSESLNWTSWDVSAWQGRTARIEVVDENTGGWGHVLADNFRAADAPERPLSDETAVNLVVDGKVVASATGENSGVLNWHSWDVAAYMGHKARIQIADRNTTNDFGHFLVDYIVFSDRAKDVGHWVDYGSDFYAVTTFNGVPGGRRIGVGWMSNWDYAGSTPTSPWRSAQTFARELRLVTVDGKTRLVQKPVNELKSLRLEPALDTAKLAVPPGVTPLKVENPGGQPAEIRADFVPGNASGFGLKVLTGRNGEETVVGYDAVAGEVYIDRTKSGNASFSSTFAARHAAPLPVRNGLVKLRVIVDRSSVTVFAGDHEVVLTDQVFPDPSSQGMAVFAAGGHAELRKLTVWPLKSIWARQ
jgi:sucrose-6-phosphate hydrolase SacC (GH32 family)